MRNRTLFALALALVVTSSANTATLPKLEASSLSETHVTLPAEVAGKRFVLVVGYAQDSQGSLAAWAHALAKAVGPER